MGPKGDVSKFYWFVQPNPKPKDQKYNEPDIIQLSHYFRQIKSNIKISKPWLNNHSMGPKIYIPSILNTDYLLWHTQLMVCAVQY